MRHIDLNLLHVFQAVYEEGSVSKAADRLALTQSAVSHSLSRLRFAMGDKLFLNSPKGLRPTNHARELAPHIQDALTRLKSALSPCTFDPAHSRRRFNLAGGSYTCSVLLPPLVSLLRRSAPGISLRAWNIGRDTIESLSNGHIDLAFSSGEHALPSSVRTVALFRDEMVWIAAAGNALTCKLGDMRAILSAPRIAIASNRDVGDGPSFVGSSTYDDEHERENCSDAPPQGSTISVVYDPATAVDLVCETDAVACVPRRFASLVSPSRLAILGSMRPKQMVTISMLWHARTDNDRAICWLRNQIEEMVRGAEIQTQIPEARE
ncbi:MAG: LysR family transcriptional regulator [Steroidobacteraceae bacterium]